MSAQTVNECLARLEVVYPHHFKQNGQNAKFALQVFHEILDDIDGSLLIAATKQWLSTARQFHPSPGELRDLALTLITRNEPSVDEAWLEFERAKRNVGYYGIPQWSNERVARTVEALGRWKDVCLTELDQLPIIRAQFMRIYEAQTKRQHEDRLMLSDTRQRVEELIGQTAKRLQAPR